MMVKSAKHGVILCTFIVLLLGTGAAESRAAMYTGSLSSTDGGLIVGGDWDYATHTLSWVVTNENPAAPPGWWHYSYTLSVTELAPPLSTTSELGIYDVLVEVSGAFTQENLQTPTGPLWPGTIGLFTPGDGYPGLPDGIFGLHSRYDAGVRTAQLDFYSNRVPVWGDLYANATTVLTSGPTAGWLTNVGFGNPDSDPDPFLYPAHLHPGSKDVAGHLLVPDTHVVPVPGAAVLGMIGMATAGWLKRRRGL